MTTPRSSPSNCHKYVGDTGPWSTGTSTATTRPPPTHTPRWLEFLPYAAESTADKASGTPPPPGWPQSIATRSQGRAGRAAGSGRGIPTTTPPTLARQDAADECAKQPTGVRRPHLARLACPRRGGASRGSRAGVAERASRAVTGADGADKGVVGGKASPTARLTAQNGTPTSGGPRSQRGTKGGDAQPCRALRGWAWPSEPCEWTLQGRVASV